MYASCKMRSLQLFIGVVLLLNRVRFNYGYTVETVKLEVFNDKFRASIPSKVPNEIENTQNEV